MENVQIVPLKQQAKNNHQDESSPPSSLGSSNVLSRRRLPYAIVLFLIMYQCVYFLTLLDSTASSSSSSTATTTQKRYYDDPKTLKSLFLHIPKAGGTVVSKMMQQCFAQLNLNTCKIGAGNSFDHVCERTESRIQQTLQNIQTQFYSKQQQQQQQPQNATTNTTFCQYLETHYDYSLVDWMLLNQQQQHHQDASDLSEVESSSLLSSSSSSPFDTMTLLRDPIQREISAWKFQSLLGKILGEPSLYIQEEVQYSSRSNNFRSRRCDNNFTDQDLKRQKYGREHNHMTRQLAGVLWGCSQKRRGQQDDCANDKELLKLAKRNLQKINHVFVYEQLQEIPNYLESVFGCHVTIPQERYQQKGQYYGHQNSSVPSLLIKELNRHNYLDTELYDYAKQLWNAQKKKE